MKLSKVCAVATSLLLFSFAITLAVKPVAGQSPAPAATQKLDKKEILDKARQAYYVLQNLGVKTFQCTVQPDWKKMLDSVGKKSTEAGDPLLTQLAAVSFTAVVDEQGNATLTPTIPIGGAADPGVTQIIDGAQKMLMGFFQTWASLAFGNPYPSSNDANLTFSDQADGYHFTEKSGEQNIEMVLGRDYALITLKVTAPGVIIVTHPRFTKTDKGFLMAGAASDINNGAQKVDIQVEYQTVEGFQFPQKVSYLASLQDMTVAVEMNFAKFQITKR